MTRGIVDQHTLHPVVEGYPERLSCAPGEALAMCCSARVPSFDVTVHRVGMGRILMWQATGLRASLQPVPDDAATHGCRWPVTFTIPVGDDWPSGFYEVALAGAPLPGDDPRTAVSHACFVVRGAVTPSARSDDGRILLVLSTNTWNAYNTFGGTCLYRGATQVSFRRPLDRGFVQRDEGDYDGRVAATERDGDPGHARLLTHLAQHRLPMWCASSGWHNWERRFVRWAEAAGFTLDVAVSADLDARPELLERYALLLSVGHDEYWTWGMRDAVDAFVDGGGNHAIFSGNTCFWQVRLDHDAGTMTCFKGAAAHDPVVGTPEAHLRTSCWSDPAIGRPETSTIGLTFSRGGYARVGRGTPRSAGGFTVHRPEHWAFEGTGLCWGDQLGAGATIVGYETDGCELALVHGRPVPTGTDGAPRDMEILATAPARLLSQDATTSEIPHALWADPDGPGDLQGVATMLFGSASPEHTEQLAYGHAVVGTFRRGRGTVFNAGTTDWSYGLDADPLVQRVTANVLRRLSSRAVPR